MEPGSQSQYTVNLDGVQFSICAYDSAEATSKALRKRFGFRTRLIGDTVVRVGRHGRPRKTLVKLKEFHVLTTEGE
jgi:hypothetical protein